MPKPFRLTDSMSTDLKAKIKRVSDQNRNPNNRANEEELAYIQQAKTLLGSGEIPDPRLVEKPHAMIGYYPIVTNDLCLKCHGDAK